MCLLLTLIKLKFNFCDFFVAFVVMSALIYLF